MVRDERLHQKFGDFDDHLEDVTIGMCGSSRRSSRDSEHMFG